MTGCRDWNDRLLDLAIDALKPSQARLVAAHVRSCAACAAALSEFCARAGQIDAALHQLVQEAQPASGFPARLLGATEALSQPAAWPSRQFGRIAAVALLALVVAEILLPVPGRWRPSGLQVAPGPETAIASWRSPSEALLYCSGDTLLRSTPQLGQFYFHMQPLQKNTGKKQGGKDDQS